MYIFIIQCEVFWVITRTDEVRLIGVQYQRIYITVYVAGVQYW